MWRTGGDGAEPRPSARWHEPLEAQGPDGPTPLAVIRAGFGRGGVGEGGGDVIGAAGGELRSRVAPGRDREHRAADVPRRRDVARSVSHDERLARVIVRPRLAEARVSAAATTRSRASPSWANPPIACGPHSKWPSSPPRASFTRAPPSRLPVHEAERERPRAERVEQARDAGEHLVPRVDDLLPQVLEVALEDGVAGAVGVRVPEQPERLAHDEPIGHAVEAERGEATRERPAALLERALQGAAAGAARRDERAVDVEQDDREWRHD